MNLPVIVLGGGGHAKVLIDTLRVNSEKIIGFTEKNNAVNEILGVPFIGSDQEVLKYSPDDVRLVVGLGSVKDTIKRTNLYNEFVEMNYRFVNVIHPSAVIPSSTEFGQGVQVMAGAIIQPGVKIANNIIINTKVSIDHDCQIGNNVHIAPGVTVSGGVKIGNGVHIGTGAIIIQGITIGDNCIVGAGALVLKDVPDGVTVIGTPAKERS